MHRPPKKAAPPPHLPINNSSYATKSTLWHAVALQQQMLGDLSLGPRRRRRASPAPTAPAAASDDDDDREPPPPPLTLAQRMGLAAAPDPELSTEEWQIIAERSRDREASRQPCTICHEGFADAPQVLLSCSHVFHRACLRAWEAHSKSKNCPICRKLHYRRRRIFDGANLYRGECATKVQAAWRGCASRAATEPLLRATNPRLRRKFAERQLGQMTDALVAAGAAGRSEIDELFAEIESSVAASRRVLSAAADPTVVDAEWADAERRARDRGLDSGCAICLANFGAGERLALLSCSHVFHARCLTSFETFALTPAACRCPVCRQSHYTKVAISAVKGVPPPERSPVKGADEEEEEMRCEPCEPEPALAPQPAPQRAPAPARGRGRGRAGGRAGPVARSGGRGRWRG